MNSGVVNVVAKLLGFGGLWDKINGSKTYLGAAAQMLTGASTLLGCAAAIINKALGSVHSLGDLVNFAQGLPSDPAAIAAAAAWAVFLQGWNAMAVKHSHEKLAAKLETPAPPAP